MRRVVLCVFVFPLLEFKLCEGRDLVCMFVAVALGPGCGDVEETGKLCM